LARLREELLRRQREASEAGKEAAGAAHAAADGSAGDFFAPGNIFSVVLTSAILWLQFGFFRREWQTIDQKYRSLGATHSSAGLRPAPDFSWGEIVQYRLDLFYAKEPFAKGYIILNGAFIVVLLGAILLSVVQGENLGTALWESWTFVADPGTQVQVGGDKPSLRPLAIALTLAGLVTFALLVGLITESVSEQVDNFKKGISKVLDQDHVLMLGWTAKSLAIIEQLAFANKSQGGATIVVLANAAKEDMENELRSAALDAQHNPLRLHNSKVIFRGGDPLLENELVKVGITRCRTAIALSRDDLESEEADGLMLRQVCVYVCVWLMFCKCVANVFLMVLCSGRYVCMCVLLICCICCYCVANGLMLRQALSISGALGNVRAQTMPVVMELMDIDSFNIVNLVNLNSEIVVTHDIVGQIMVSCSRQPGLAFLLEKLASFENSEFYFKAWPQLYGQCFSDLVCAFDDAIVLGIKREDGAKF
jgi:hypothetical protein